MGSPYLTNKVKEPNSQHEVFGYTLYLCQDSLRALSSLAIHYRYRHPNIVPRIRCIQRLSRWKWRWPCPSVHNFTNPKHISGINAMSLHPSLPSYPTGRSGYAFGHGGYVGPLAGVLPLKIYPNGAVVPVDVNAALPLAGPSVPLDSHPNGALVPVEPVEVIQARAAALAALDAGGDGRASNAPNFAAGTDGLIAIGNALVPGNSVSDTDDVAAAKRDFFDAFNSKFQ